VNVEIDKKSLKQLQEKLSEMVEKDKEATFKGMVKTGYRVEGEAAKKCSVDFGRVRNSLSVEGDATKMEVRVGTNVKYAPFVEFGTRPHTPPFNVIQEWAIRKGISPGAVWTAIRRKGTKPHPFLRPAFASQIGYLIRDIKGFIEK